MSIRGTILVPILLLILFATALPAASEGGVSLNFSFIQSESDVVQKSLAMEYAQPAFQDTDNDGKIDLVKYDGTNIPVNLDLDSAVGFSFEDGARAAFYPSFMAQLPASGTYEVLGFLHYWNATRNSLVAILLHQDNNFQTSEGIIPYIINNAGVRTGALAHMFIDKAAIRYTPPYQQWLDTGKDFAIGSSPTISNYFLIGKDLGLMDTVLVVNLSLTRQKSVSGQEMKIREHESWVVEESKNATPNWGTITSPITTGSQSVTVAVDNKEVTGTILADQAQGFSYRNERSVVFFPSSLSSIPASPESGINWELMGILHYFNETGDINSRLAVLLGQAAGEETTKGTHIILVDNTGTLVGLPKLQFHSRRSARLISTAHIWEDDEMKRDWAIGRNDGLEEKLFIVKDLGLTDQLLFTEYGWF